MAAGTYTAANVALSVVPDMSGFFSEVDRKVGGYTPKPITPKVTPEVDTEQASKAVDGFGENVKSRLSSAGTALGGFAQQWKTVALGVVAAGGAVAMTFGNAAADAEQSMGAVETVFKGSADQIKAWADGAAQNLGLSANAYREAATLIGSQLKNMGVPMEQVTGQTDDLITKAADLASMFGGTTQEAVDALSSALKGEMDPIERYGISLNMSAVNAKKAELGLGGLEGQADRTATATATLALIEQQSADATGNFGREHDTASNAVQRAQAEWDNLKVTLGDALLPVMSSVGNVLGGVLLPLLRDNAGVVTGVAIAIGALAGGVLLINGIMAVHSAVTSAVTMATKGWALAQQFLNSAFLANPITWVVIGIVALVAAVIYAWNNFEWFRDAVMAVWDGLKTFAGWIVTAFVAAWDAVVVAVRWVGDLFTTVWGAIVAAAQWSANALAAAWGAIVTAARWVGDVASAVWGALVAAFVWVADTATWLWQTILQPIFNFIGAAALLLAQVIAVLVVAPLIYAWEALGAAWSFVWTNVLKPVIDAYGAFVRWINENVIMPTLNAIAAAWAAMGAAVRWVFDNVIMVAWNAMIAAVMYVWNNVMVPVFAAIAAAWAAMAAAVRWVFDNVIMVAWNAMITAINWLWNSVLLPIFNAITAAWAALGAGLRWVYDNVIKVCWDALIAAINWVWNSVLLPIFNAITAAWAALGNGLRWVFDNVIKPMFDALVAAGDWVKQRFDDVVGGLGRAWDALKEAFAVPIRFVVNTVWNDGIGGLWDKAKAILPLGDFPRVQLGFADGGWVPGYSPGVDSVLAMVSPGEGWVRPEVGRARGGKRWIDQVNSIAKREGTRGVERFMLYGGESMQQFADGGVVAGQQFARGQAGKPYVWGGAGPNGFDCSGFMSAITNFLQGVSPVFQRRFATSSFSGGRGVAGFVPGLSSAFTIGVSPNTGGGIGHMAGTLGGLNVESRGGDGVVVGPGARGADSTLFPWKFSLPQVGGAFVSGGGGDGWFVQTLRSIVEPIYDTAASGINSLVSMAFPGNGTLTGDMPKMFTETLLAKVRDAIFGKADELDASAGSAGGGAAVEFGPVQEQVRAIAARFGWNQGPEWDALVRLVQKESSWNPAAANATTSARGLFQKMTSIHGPIEGSPGGQAMWGLNYIKGKYGSPSAAWRFHQGHNWYDNGGWLPPGATMAMNGTGKPEAILTHEQWDLLSASSRIPSEGGDTYVINPSTPMDEVQIARETARIQQFNKRLAV